jgi:transposase-like protein
MPVAHSVEFRRRTVALARSKEKPIAQLAADLGISESCLRRWMKIADTDEGVQEGATSDGRAELVRLRRENRVQAAEIEILGQASAYFAGEVVGPKRSSR